MNKRSNLALVKTQTATAAVVVRPAGKDRFGCQIISQHDIDRIPDGHRPDYKAQLFGKIATGQISHRSFWQRVKGKFF